MPSRIVKLNNYLFFNSLTNVTTAIMDDYSREFARGTGYDGNDAFSGRSD